MKGFHVCKPGNAPTVGQVKSLIVVGDRIKSKPLDQGGQNYTVTAVTVRESYKDSYGNVGYDIEIEPATGQGTPQPRTNPPNAFGSQAQQPSAGGMSKDDYWTRKEERDIEASQRMNRSHAQDMAIQYWTLLASGGGITPEDCKDTQKLRAMIEWFQRDSWRTATTSDRLPDPANEEEEIY
jgi:hypothetical protein